MCTVARPAFNRWSKVVALSDVNYHRLIGRLAVEYNIGTFIKLTQFYGGNWRRAAIVIVTVLSNSAHLIKDLELGLKYAATPPEDDDKRPITLSAIARGLHFSRESVRRQVAELMNDGVMDRVSNEGFIVRTDYLTRPDVEALIRYMAIGFVDIIAQLKLFSIEYPKIEGATPIVIDIELLERPPIYMITRAAGQFLFNCYFDAMSNGDKFYEFIIEYIVVKHNIKTIVLEMAFQYLASNDVAPDEHRLPMTISEIAEAVSISTSTAYRHIGRMIRDGRLVKAGAGYIVPASRLLARLDYLERINGYFDATMRALQRFVTIDDLLLLTAAMKADRRP